MTSAELVLAYLSAFASGDPESIVAYVSENFENNQINELGSGCKGKSAYRERLKDFLGMFTGLNYVPEELIVDDNRVAVAYRMHATERGIPIDIRGAMLIRVSGGLIDRRDDYWDGLSYRRQTGNIN